MNETTLRVKIARYRALKYVIPSEANGPSRGI